MGEHKRNPVAVANIGAVSPYQLTTMQLLQRVDPKAIIVRGQNPTMEWQLHIQIERKGSTLGKRMQVGLKAGASAVDLARALINTANFLLSVDAQPETDDADLHLEQQPTTTDGARNNGEDHSADQAQAKGEGQAGENQSIIATG